MTLSMMTWLTVFVWGLLGASVIILVRNFMVHAYRNKLIDALYQQPNWRELRDLFLAVDYNDMVFMFWRKFDSFYPDKLTKLIKK